MDDLDDTGRRRALQDLGSWPVRRDRLTGERVALLGAAWRAGNRNVRELARTADVSRDVVYNDLRSIGIDPTDPAHKLEPAVAREAHGTALDRLEPVMARLFAGDNGMGALKQYAGRPDLTEAQKEHQDAWAKALFAAHGSDRAIRGYLNYSQTRHRELAAGGQLVQVEQLVDEGHRYSRWERDVYGFLCVSCAAALPAVEWSGDHLCTNCVAGVLEDDFNRSRDLVPLWRSASHRLYAVPGMLDSQRPDEPFSHLTAVAISEDGATSLKYVGGDATLLWRDARGLPGLGDVVCDVKADPGTSAGATLSARVSAEESGRRLELAATYVYDALPDGEEPYPYGFRFVAGSLQRTDVPGVAVEEFSDLHAFIDAVLGEFHPSVGRLGVTGG